MFVQKKRFVQKIREAILYAQFLESEEQKSHEAIWRKKFPEYPDNMTVFEEVGMKLQKIEELHTREVDFHIQNIVRDLNAYRVAFGDDETKQKPLAEVMLEVIAHWNKPPKIYTESSFAGPPSVLGVMLIEYLQRLQGTSFVPATLVVKPATVVVLLMLAIKYNDDHAPSNPIFYHLLGSYAAMMSLSLKQNGMTFTAPRFADLDDCFFKNYLSKADQQAFENETRNAGPESAIMLYTALINQAPMKNIHRKFALRALHTLEFEVLTALDWKLDALVPIDSHDDDQVWSLKDHAKHNNFWFWKRLAQINREPRLAFVMGTHARLGQDSPVLLLDRYPELLELVCSFAGI